MTAHDDLLEAALGPAADLICAVRDDVTGTHRILLEDCPTIDQLRALVIVLACMVSPDQRVTDLLAWTHVPAPTEWDEPRRRDAHRRYARGQRDPRTVDGERAYQRARRRPARSNA